MIVKPSPGRPLHPLSRTTTGTIATVRATDHLPAHGHGHGHTPAGPASAPVRRLLLVLLLPLVLATVAGALVLYPFGQEIKTGSEVGINHTPVRGEATKVEKGPCAVGLPEGTPVPQDEGCFLVTVRMTDGAAADRDVTIPVPDQPTSPTVSAGDEVVLSYSGTEPTSPLSYQLVDFQRGLPLSLLALLFVGAVLVLGRWHGLRALGALGLSFVVLALFVLPAILAGEDPLWVAVVGAGLIMFVVLYVSHGVSARTSTAVLGTLVSLALIGALGALFGAGARLTGLDEQTANLVTILGHGIDTRGLLLAGTIIGALGVLDDVTVTQTSAVWELRAANPSMGFGQLYAAGARIGRDHLSSVVNTLVMAYAGAALPLMLSFALSGQDLGTILTAQDVAQEIVQTLVGSIGLVAAVPVTTALAAFVAAREEVVAGDDEEPAPAEDDVEDGVEEDEDDEPVAAERAPEPTPPPARSRIAGDLRYGYDPSKEWERVSPRSARPPAPPRRARPGRRGFDD
ncbi:YibE/F family protein [Actinosynnema pretiosum subsp. pretiosum]|uniref:YibE/F family protein n=1 Tax=Actinosynnema pretiosum subsp. pretiosum TaxID=103721 RepID=A0AA45LBB9_9PSEU|nr:YibE/F family protein [Actinosynnema pretiosum subsp. pretiosum]